MSKPPQAKPDLSLREKAISRLIDSDKPNDDSLLKLVEVLGQDGAKSPELVADIVQARAERRRRWWDLPVVAAVATAVSGLVTIALQGGVDVWKQREVALQEFKIEEMKLTRAAFEKLMYVDPEAYLVFSANVASSGDSGDEEDGKQALTGKPTDESNVASAGAPEDEADGEQGVPVEPTDENDVAAADTSEDAMDGEQRVPAEPTDENDVASSDGSSTIHEGIRKGFLEWAEVERRNRLCVAVDFGIIRIPDEFLEGFQGSNSYDRVSAFMKDYECDRGTLPTETPLAEASSSNEPVSLSGCDRTMLKLGGQLPIPNGLDSANPNHVALQVAIGERNSGVHETDCKQRLDHYWSVLNSQLRTDERTPWGAVFTSYLLLQSGNSANIRTSVLHSEIWASATSVGKSTPGIEGVEVGDLVFRVRLSGPYPTESGLVSAIRTGDYQGVWTGFSGIVYSIDQERQEMIVIGGNVTDMVREITVKLDDPRKVGFVQQ